MNDPKQIYVLIEHLRGQVGEITFTLLAAANELANKTDSQVTAILLGHQIQELANVLAATQIYYIDHPALADYTPQAYQKILAELLRVKQPRLFLFGETSIGAEIAGVISSTLDIPLVSYCQDIYLQDEQFKFTSQICGGKLIVRGGIPEPTALVTMIPGAVNSELGHSDQPKDVRILEAPDLSDLGVQFKQYIEPQIEDIDISKEAILVGVGRGITNPDDIEIAEELATALGGVVSASRPIVDQGWLPVTRLVGKSGKRVKPKLYLALGISGATEHVEAITDSEMIVAINTDPAAPIFQIAKYGAVTDLFDLAPELTKQVKQARAVQER